MQLRLPAPAFYGAMNFSGDLRAWSFTNMTWPDQTHELSRIVRFAGSEGSELWSFWVAPSVAAKIRHGLSMTRDFTVFSPASGP